MFIYEKNIYLDKYCWKFRVRIVIHDYHHCFVEKKSKIFNKIISIICIWCPKKKKVDSYYRYWCSTSNTVINHMNPRFFFWYSTVHIIFENKKYVFYFEPASQHLNDKYYMLTYFYMFYTIYLPVGIREAWSF